MPPLFILENRYRASTEEGVVEGTTLHREPEWPSARATRPMTVSVVRVRGAVKNVKVRLGEETLELPVGLNELKPPREVKKGDALDISFAGDGSVELACEREDRPVKPRLR
ncbi:MAG TPA: hypothetical protein VNV25_25755 [Gemmatimonadaceae bacterium]|jgi:hypothetical protein|nr:hypothetical protein [Gemmatimonadaceae bacterium]